MKRFIATAITTIAIAATLGTVSANSDIEWTYIPASEVETIDNVDFLYTDSGICWGITYHPTSNDIDTKWTIEVITGDYEIIRLVPSVDISPAIGCKTLDSSYTGYSQ